MPGSSEQGWSFFQQHRNKNPRFGSLDSTCVWLSGGLWIAETKCSRPAQRTNVCIRLHRRGRGAVWAQASTRAMRRLGTGRGQPYDVM